MKIEPPLLTPKKVNLQKLTTPSLRVHQPNHVSLKNKLEEIEQYGVPKGNDRMREDLNRVLDVANQRIQASKHMKTVQFEVHEESGRYVVSLIDQKTGQEIKSYPAEKILENSSILTESLKLNSLKG